MMQREKATGAMRRPPGRRRRLNAARSCQERNRRRSPPPPPPRSSLLLLLWPSSFEATMFGHALSRRTPAAAAAPAPSPPPHQLKAGSRRAIPATLPLLPLLLTLTGRQCSSGIITCVGDTSTSPDGGRGTIAKCGCRSNSVPHRAHILTANGWREEDIRKHWCNRAHWGLL